MERREGRVKQTKIPEKKEWKFSFCSLVFSLIFIQKDLALFPCLLASILSFWIIISQYIAHSTIPTSIKKKKKICSKCYYHNINLSFSTFSSSDVMRLGGNLGFILL